MKDFARFSAKCEFCGLELDTEQEGVAQLWVGWADADDNFVEPVQRHYRWAHQHCVEDAERQRQAEERHRRGR